MKTKKTKKTVAPAEPPVAEPLGQQVCETVREMRKKRGWTLDQLAAHSGVSRSMLSQIERGGANPTLGVAFRIAQAFGLSLGQLVDVPAARPRIEMIRSHDGGFLFRDDPACRIRTLSPLQLEKDVEFYELTLKPRGALASAPHFEGTREFLTVVSGRVRVTSATDVSELEAGDSAQYPADVPHAIENLGAGEAVVFLVVIYARAGKR